MIRAKSITIEEFRGIRSLTIDFNEKNFAVCGPNGTGKSGIVDALEFALTGNISRLSGKGMGTVSLKDHAPHVDSRNRPDKARVILTLSIPHLGKEVKIERNVKDASNPTITPDSSDVRAALEEVALHPEFVLSRRELIRYVISAPGDRAKEVQALLRLDSVENLRAVLFKIANAKQKEIAPLQREKVQAKAQLLTALQITEFSEEKILIAVNARRIALSLPPLLSLAPPTSVRDGLAATPAMQAGKIPKVQALAELKKLEESLERIMSLETGAVIAVIAEQLELLNANPTAANSVSKERFLQTSLTLIEDESCPVCDKPWDIAELKNVIGTKLKGFEETAAKRSEIEKALEPLLGTLEEISNGLSTISRYAPLLSPSIDIQAVRDFKNVIDTNRKHIGAFVPLAATTQAVKNIPDVPAEAVAVIAAVADAITAIPEATEQDAARDYLTIVQVQLENYRRVSQHHKKTEAEADLTKKVYDTYTSATTSVLGGIYEQVEKDFGELYRDVNKDDESTFTAQLVPTTGKLGLDVDFFGRGFFPPGAYHSEGHQDGMGICLYLALMKHMLGDAFTFAVLDDVLMSVDAGHRREVCYMLKKHFPHTQFIFTTHDDIWLEHMKNAGLIARKAAMQFRAWDVENGPTKWDDRDVWQQIKDEAAANKVNEAAGLLRRYLEHISAELCHRLGARVQYRSDAKFELGDLLPPVVSRYKKLLKEGKASAQSWSNAAELAAITAREEEFAELVEKTNIEQWMLNAAVHYNQWENLQAADFMPVVAAYENLLGAFVCANLECASVFYILPERGDNEELRCACGSTTINLRIKPSTASNT